MTTKINPSEWRLAETQLACGCYARAHIYGDISSEVALHRYFATYWPHSNDHRELCAEWLLVNDPTPPTYKPFFIDDIKVG